MHPSRVRTPSGSEDCAPRAQRLHEQPDGTGAVSHVGIIGRGPLRPRRRRRPRGRQQLLGLFVPAARAAYGWP